MLALAMTPTRAIWPKLLSPDVHLRRALMTHFHPDHIGNGGWLESEHHAAIYMTEREFLTAHSARYLPESDERQQRQLFFHQLGLPDSETTVKTARSFYPTNTPTLPQRFVGYARAIPLNWVAAIGWSCVMAVMPPNKFVFITRTR